MMMYYRRKLLLALVEFCGGKVKRTDCLKLLFLFCQYTKRNYYDFFPHKYGGFSLIAYQDKNRLTTLGFLRDSDDFELISGNSFISQLKTPDQKSLHSIVSTLNTLKGTALVKKAYIEYPEYTCRSEILTDILTQNEIKQIQTYWNTDASPRLFTIGYQGITIDAYLHRLIANNVRVLVDVRKNPLSMKYGFSKTRLRKYIENAEIQYVHLPELGIPSQLRQHLESDEAYKQLFEKYEAEILPTQCSAIKTITQILGQHKRIALTCFETDYHYCHRHKITAYLENMPDFKTSIIHL